MLEVALQQEECDTCNTILDLADQGLISLVVPAFSLAEPHVAIVGKEKLRHQLRRDLESQVRDLARSKPHRTVSSDFAAFAAVLAASAQFEREGVRDTVSNVVNRAQVIPLDATILKSALEAQAEVDISG